MHICTRRNKNIQICKQNKAGQAKILDRKDAYKVVFYVHSNSTGHAAQMLLDCTSF